MTNTRIDDPCAGGDGQACAPLEACVCVTLARDELQAQATRLLGAAMADNTLAERWQHMFAHYPVFVPAAGLRRMAEVIAAIERVVALPAWHATSLADAPETARHDPRGARGVFLGYDFHLDGERLGLIEINTNAGGALVNTLLARAQHACCNPIAALQPSVHDADEFERRIVDMFRSEWEAAGTGRPLTQVAIVDLDPPAQHLYPEFLLFRSLFEKHGIRACIADPSQLEWRDGRLWCGEQALDLVYNRLTDFYLESPAAAALRTAYLADAVVLTPHPRAHALYADKSRLVSLSDPLVLKRLGVSAADRELILAAVPRTERVTPHNADELWARRRTLFFKPRSGYGGRATYRGDKLTKRVWAGIVGGDYVAQALVAPPVRPTSHAPSDTGLKFDLRNYVYAGEVQWVAARLYQGQATNFRTPGGGFAPVYTTPGQAHAPDQAHASYIFLLGAGGVQPLPHALYVALARGEAWSPAMAGRSFRLVDWHVRVKAGEPCELVREWYGWVRFDAQGRFEPAGVPMSNNHATLADTQNVDTSALPGPAELQALKAAVFGPSGGARQVD